MRRGLKFPAVLITVALCLVIYVVPRAQRASRATVLSTQSLAEIRAADLVVDRMIRSGELRSRQVRPDTILTGRSHERFDQYYKGVRVFGGDISRQSRAGVTESVFGQVYDIDIDTTPAITAESALDVLRRETAGELTLTSPAELVILPRDDSFFLAYRVRVVSANKPADFFLDARTGATLLSLSNIQTASAVGSGKGVLGDTKKVSDDSVGATFLARDLLRPPAIRTYDMRGNLSRVTAILNGVIPLSDVDLASTTSANTWSDPAIVDAHAYTGMLYDFYFKRFGRRGLDNNNIPLVSLVHPVLRENAQNSAPSDAIFYINAFWDGDLKMMVYGDGLPPNLVVASTQQHWNYTSGALDIVGHELTHGVTQFTSNLINQNESGALNESFSDMMGTSAEFFYRTPASGSLQADYLIGADVIRGPLNGIRSMANPAMFGHPDHYTKRVPACTTRCDESDQGGIHSNSGISNNAFYLAIESGTNRTSGLAVQGVGAANREQIEKVFYRAFTSMLPSGATFSIARSATIQSARDLYGAGSAAERAVTQAWTAVGVN